MTIVDTTFTDDSMSSWHQWGKPEGSGEINLEGRSVAGYRLLQRVGEGGTATVYRAEHPERGRAAVKILRERMRNDPTAVKRFLREAGYGSRVEHPSVVRTFDYGEEDGLYYDRALDDLERFGESVRTVIIPSRE